MLDFFLQRRRLNWWMLVLKYFALNIATVSSLRQINKIAGCKPELEFGLNGKFQRYFLSLHHLDRAYNNFNMFVSIHNITLRTTKNPPRKDADSHFCNASSKKSRIQGKFSHDLSFSKAADPLFFFSANGKSCKYQKKKKNDQALSCFCQWLWNFPWLKTGKIRRGETSSASGVTVKLRKCATTWKWSTGLCRSFHG